MTEDRLRLIPRGIDPAVFDPRGIAGLRVGKLAQAWSIPEGAKVILLPARLSRWKGQSVVIAALGLLMRPDLFVVFVGSDQGRHAYLRSLLDEAAALGVTGQIKLVGHCADMPAALMLADIVVNASTEPEAFGRAVIEAQAMERVVIAADHGGASETVTQGDTGVLVPPGDAIALAEAIATALSWSEDERHAMGARARASVLESLHRRGDAAGDARRLCRGARRGCWSRAITPRRENARFYRHPRPRAAGLPVGAP